MTLLADLLSTVFERRYAGGAGPRMAARDRCWLTADLWGDRRDLGPTVARRSSTASRAGRRRQARFFVTLADGDEHRPRAVRTGARRL
jgi:hypothetical protein